MSTSSSSAADPASNPLVPTAGLRRHFGVLQATALNVTMMIGAGVFVTIPPILKQLPGPYALLAWLVAGGLMLVDGMIWSELGATLPGSGGSYLYLLESYGRERWGRLVAFLFIWQFLISGPLEIGSGLIAMAQFANDLSPTIREYNERWPGEWVIWPEAKLAVFYGPARWAVMLVGVGIVLLLYRRITSLGRLTVTFWLGVLGAGAWILIEGWLRFRPAVAFDWPPPLTGGNLAANLGAAMIPAMYAYLGYYHVCYIGDEVREPGRTIPRAIMGSALLVMVLFLGLHLALLGTISWRSVPTEETAMASYSLPAEFMRRIHGEWAAVLISLLLIWSIIGSSFAGLLGYSRIPYGAARYGHFFSVLGRVHPVHEIPHVALLLVGGLTLFWSFFDLENVIKALITTRILQQFIGQIIGVMLLRRAQPQRIRPYKIWLYPLPCGLALAGWLYMFLASGWEFVALGLGTIALGTGVFVLWSRRTGGWPFTRDGRIVKEKP